MTTFARGIPAAHQTPEPIDPFEFVNFVVPLLTVPPADTRRANTVLMAFAARWDGEAFDLVKLALKIADQSVDDTDLVIACFEPQNDPTFAIPLSTLLNAKERPVQPAPGTPNA